MTRAAWCLALAVCSIAVAQSDSRTREEVRLQQSAKVYLHEGCADCHSIAGKIAAKGGVSGYPLDGVGTRLTAKEIRAVLLDPELAAHPRPAGPRMKSYRHLSKTDLDNLVAYVCSLKTLDTPR